MPPLSRNLVYQTYVDFLAKWFDGLDTEFETFSSPLTSYTQINHAMNKLLLALCLTLCAQLVLEAQIPQNFNFLNHDRFDAEVRDFITQGDDLVSASQYGFEIITGDYQIDHYNSCAENQKLIYVNDSTFHFVNWFFNCSDTQEDALRTHTSRNGVITRDDYDDFLAENNVIRQANDITYDSTGGWWCFAERSRFLYHLEQGRITDTIQMSSFGGRLFTSCSGDIYVLRGLDILYFNGEEVAFFSELPRASAVYQDGEFNYLLEDDKLYKYDCELRVQLNEWTLPISVTSFDQIDFRDEETVYVNEINEDSYHIYAIDGLSNILFEYSGVVEEDETLAGLLVTSDSTHLIYGQHQFELTSHSFYRNIHTQLTLEYPTSQVEISDFELETSRCDTIYDFLLDTTLLFCEAQPHVQVFNPGDEIIYAMSGYSSSFTTPINVGGWVPMSRFFYSLDSELQSMESRDESIFSKSMYLDQAAETRLEFNGANYKFLQNGPIMLSPEITTATVDIESNEFVQVYPNPARDHIVVKTDRPTKLTLANIQGQVFSQQEQLSTETTLDISMLPTGLYFLISEGGDCQRHVQKFEKIR